MAWHPVWRGTRALVDELDRRETRRGGHGPRQPASHWALEHLDLFREIPRPQLEELIAQPRVETCTRGTPALVDDAAVRVLVSGGLKLARVGVTGRKLIVAILGRGDVFGRISAYSGGDDGGDSYVVEALEPTEMLVLGRDTFERLLERHPFAYRIVQVLEERQRELVRRVESLAFKDVHTRLCETLLELATAHGDPCAHGMAVDIRITQQDLADLIGASRQMVNRILGELSRKLYVRRMGRVLCILNRQRLERLAACAEPLSTG